MLSPVNKKIYFSPLHWKDTSSLGSFISYGRNCHSTWSPRIYLGVKKAGKPGPLLPLNFPFMQRLKSKVKIHCPGVSASRRAPQLIPQTPCPIPSGHTQEVMKVQEVWCGWALVVVAAPLPVLGDLSRGESHLKAAVSRGLGTELPLPSSLKFAWSAC